MPWFTEEWSRGILLGLDSDPNTGYRATIWFEYTRALFNQIREGSLVAVRNFNDRRRDAAEGRDQSYEEFSILQIDQVHPWHYAIQGTGDHGYPAFNVAAAESARQDWVEWDSFNRDDVTRIRCEAIPLRLAFARPQAGNALPPTFPDRSKPMPGHEVRVLLPSMTESIVNQGLDTSRCIEIGHHVVQPEVAVRISLPDLVCLHFGVFGFTGAGKSNLISTPHPASLIASCGFERAARNQVSDIRPYGRIHWLVDRPTLPASVLQNRDSRPECRRHEPNRSV